MSMTAKLALPPISFTSWMAMVRSFASSSLSIMLQKRYAACGPPPRSSALTGVTPNSERSYIDALAEHGITLEQLGENAGQPDADPFDLLCYVAFNAPLRTRRERAERLRKGRVDFWEYFKPEAQQILNEILDKYIEYGTAQFKVPDILKVQPISQHGNVVEIAAMFGGADQLRGAIEQDANVTLR